MEYETVIGLEVHAQLLTKSKMFCRCSADYANAPPNTYVCPVCLGMPGVLPVINRKAVDYTIMTALALNCQIAEQTKFDRKNYPYPDLVKGYQISQYDAPISRNGWLDIEMDSKAKRIGIIRVHLEEDTAKLIHKPDEFGEPASFMDVNRSGVPLMEIVGQPDLRSPEDARQYLIKLRSILQYLGVSSGNMEEGSFRCDANISLRPMGSRELFTKVEVKNMNSFKAVYQALQYEVERQARVLSSGGKIVQETRGWVEEKGETVSQRSKEYAHDYRYFPEPDLPPLAMSREWVEEIRKKLPELPDTKRNRFIVQYGLPLYDSNLLTSSKTSADFFESCLGIINAEGQPIEKKAKAVSNWMLGELARLLNASNIELPQSRVKPEHLVELLGLIDQHILSGTMAKAVFEEVFKTGKSPQLIVKIQGLAQLSDVERLSSVVEGVLQANPQAVADYKGGREQALTFLVGQVMKATRGSANPALVNHILKGKLSAKD